MEVAQVRLYDDIFSYTTIFEWKIGNMENLQGRVQNFVLNTVE